MRGAAVPSAIRASRESLCTSQRICRSEASPGAYRRHTADHQEPNSADDSADDSRPAVDTRLHDHLASNPAVKWEVQDTVGNRFNGFDLKELKAIMGTKVRGGERRGEER